MEEKVRGGGEGGGPTVRADGDQGRGEGGGEFGKMDFEDIL